MMDFDLRTPGLTMRALKQLNSHGQTLSSGLVDLIHDCLIETDHSLFVVPQNPAYYTEYVCSLNIPEHLLRIPGGKLDLMPCGRLDDDYEERLEAINFTELYAEGMGQPFVKRLGNLIRDSQRYDYILVDASTGFSDESGVCTCHLAEHIMVLTRLNQSDINGTLRFLKRLKASGWKEGNIVFILAPIATGYAELLTERAECAQREIEEKTGFKADFDLSIPYHPCLTLDEGPFAYNRPNTDLFKAYESVSKKLQKLAEDRTLLDRNLRTFIDTQFDEGIVHITRGNNTYGQELVENAIEFLKEMNDLEAVAASSVEYVAILLKIDEPQAALEHLDRNWNIIQRYAAADDRAEAYVLREQIRFK
jgi:hypothetical protein